MQESEEKCELCTLKRNQEVRYPAADISFKRN